MSASERKQRALQLEQILPLERVDPRVLRKRVDDVFVRELPWRRLRSGRKQRDQPLSLFAERGPLAIVGILGNGLDPRQPIRPALIFAEDAKLHQSPQQDGVTSVRQLIGFA